MSVPIKDMQRLKEKEKKKKKKEKNPLQSVWILLGRPSLTVLSRREFLSSTIYRVWAYVVEKNIFKSINREKTQR